MIQSAPSPVLSSVCNSVPLKRPRLRCGGIVLLPCQSYKMVQCRQGLAWAVLLMESLWQRLAVEALASQALRRLPPVPVVAAADGAVVHLHFDPGWDDRRSSKAVWTVFADRTALLWLVDRVHALGNGAVRHHAVHLVIWFTATPLARWRLEFFQNLVCFRSILAKVFDLFALWTAAIVLHFGALGVQFWTLRLITHGSILRAHARTVRVSRIKTLSQFVHEAAVVHATLPAVVIKHHVICALALRLVRHVVLWGVSHWGRGHSCAQDQHEQHSSP